MKYRLSFLLAILFYTFYSQAQNKVDRSNYTLLWEITGNDFEKPSYLFGSMHVEDKRVFDFCDSMLVCLEDCEGFSAELNLDSMMHYVLKAMFSEDTTNILRDILSPEAYEGLNNRLLNKEGKGIDELSNKQPWIIEMMLDEELPESDTDFESALDMYLYNYARKLGKETYGLEKIEDQLSLSLLKYETYQEYLTEANTDDKGTEDVNDALEQLIQVYISGDIKVIDEMFVESMPDDMYKQKLLTDRNIVMADNIELLGNQMSMFNVVGAAHLPGEMGVIELLKKKGFMLRPVSPDFTGESQFKDLSHVELPWKTLDRKEDMECVLEFPTDAVKVENIEGENMSDFDYYISMDLQTQELYMYLGIDAERELEGDEIGEILDLGLKSILDGEDGMEIVDTPYDIEYKSLNGRAIKAKNAEGFIDARAFVQGSKMYYLYVFSEKGNQGNQNRFFNSLDFHPNTIEKVKGKVIRKDYALSFDAPVSMAYSIREEYQLDGNNEKYPYPSVVHEYKGSDVVNDIFYSMQFYDMPNGMYTINEDATINRMVKNMENYGMNQVAEGEKEILTKINKKEYSFEKEGVFASFGYFLRGNRFITAFVAANSKEITEQEYEKLVSSIYLLDFEKIEFSKQGIKKAGVYAKMPTPGREELKNYDKYPYTKEAYQRISTDTNSTAVFLLETIELSSYYEIENADTFLLELQQASTKDIHNVQDIEFIKQQGHHSIKFNLLSSEKTTVITQMQITIVENWLIYAVAHLPRELYKTAYADSFFNSLDIDPSYKREEYVEDKISLIAADINTTDEVLYEELQNAIYNHKLKKENLPVVYEILKKEIPLDTSSIYYYSIKEQLIIGLADINDENTIPVLEKIFPSSTIKEQLEILNIIGRVEDSNLKTYWKLVNEIDTKHEDFSSYQAIRHFYDNPTYVFENMDGIMELSKKEDFIDDIYTLIYQSDDRVDPNWKKAVLPYKESMLELLEHKFLEWKAGREEGETGNVSLLQYLIIIQSELPDNKRFYSFLEKNISDTQGYLMTQMTGALLKNNIPAKDEIWNNIEKEHLTYAVIDNMMNEDGEYHEHPLIPKKYKNQTHAAKIGLVGAFDDDYSISEANFIRKEKIKKEGESYSLYVFEMKEKYNPDLKVIGVSLQPSNKKEYQFYPIYYNYDFYEKDNFDLEKTIEELMESFYE